MKKLVLFFASAIIAVSFSACGNKAAETENQEAVVEETMVEVVEANDSIVAQPDSATLAPAQ